MKFTKETLAAELKDFFAFSMDTYGEGFGEECKTPAEFIRRCAEAVEELEQKEAIEAAKEAKKIAAAVDLAHKIAMDQLAVDAMVKSGVNQPSRRMAVFNSFWRHAWLGRIFAKLNQNELRLCREFILANDFEPVDKFEYKINRMFLDQENKPKNFTIILELLTCANSKAHQLQKEEE